tara:strand:- start:2201 stop:2458 length:258 start_codon:yes stop_codon:yes gene_type:complete
MAEKIDKSTILSCLSEIVADILGIDDIQLAESMTASDVEGWDSMSHTRILYECELKWSIRLTLQELSSLKTIGDLLNVLYKKINS